MTTESVSFSITGEFITEHHRNLVREGEWRAAFDSLKECFTASIDTDLIFDVLMGKKKFVGVNDIGLEDDDIYLDDKWEYDQYFTYFNNIRFIDNKPYKVYGVVEYLNYHDMRKVRERFDSTSNIPGDELNRLRALTYSNNPSTDTTIHTNEGWLLCEPLDKDYPAWITKSGLKEIVEKHKYNESFGLLRYNTKEEMEILENEAIESTKYIRSTQISVDRFIENQKLADEAYERINQVREEISKLADEKGGWLELHDDENNRHYKLPKNAFYRWCLSNSSAWESIDWKPVSPQGMKMSGDDPNHTDWWLFTGHSLDDGYNHEYMEFFSMKRFEIHNELTKHDFVTLIRGDVYTKSSRTVRHIKKPEDIFMINKNNLDIVIIPNASPEFENVAHKCAELKIPVITEVGGKLCHLATVGREFGLTLLMLPDALTTLPMGCKVKLDIDGGALNISDLNIEDAMTLKLSGMMYK
ncbi:MAG: hypothetical protein R3230_01030 [Nitrosopumilaceae archaeon]|nr:hypothetical protein [Nitrosopumilaceae archaeon]